MKVFKLKRSSMSTGPPAFHCPTTGGENAHVDDAWASIKEREERRLRKLALFKANGKQKSAAHVLFRCLVARP